MTRLVIRDRETLDELLSIALRRAHDDEMWEARVLVDAIIAADFSGLTAHSGEQGCEDSRRLDWLEAWLKSSDDKDRGVESWRRETDDVWLYSMSHYPQRDGFGPTTLAEAPTIREAIDAARSTQNSDTPKEAGQ